MDVYGGGRRRLIVSSNITRSRAVSTDATRLSPRAETPAQTDVWRRGGRAVLTTFVLKQFAFPEPVASARSAQPLPETSFRTIRLPRGLHGGPGSRFTGRKVTKRAVGNTAIP